MRRSDRTRAMNPTVLACVATFAAAAALSATLLAPQVAAAKYARVSASSCVVSKNGVWATYHNNALSNGDVDGLMDMNCPVPDDDYFPHHEIRTLNVHGYDRSTRAGDGMALAQACITFYATNSGSCGTLVSTPTTGTGMFTLLPSLTAWQDEDYAYDFAFLFVRLPANDGGNARSNFRGFYITD